ncbi:heparinase II/III-family protein [Candidatus Pelagibacter sp.]|nr:heparinase II/III-family protein [Candidatus Pelagibacter sp.]
MKLNNFTLIINQSLYQVLKKIRKIYLNSAIYDKRISSKNLKALTYKPSLKILGSIAKYEKTKNKIEDFETDKIWEVNKLSYKDYKKLNNFFWLFSIDLKSSKKICISIISKWIESNQKYNDNLWEIDTLSRRIISWITNSQLTYDEGDKIYKEKFNSIIFKQTNHLINEIKRSDNYHDKLIGCSAIILTGISYNDEKFLDFGLQLLKKIITSCFDTEYFPKSRNIRQLVFYLKYFIILREFLRESSNEIPEYLDEIIFHLGKGYNFVWGSVKQSLLFNGNHNSNLEDFDVYLDYQKYSFKSEKRDLGGYGILKNKNVILGMDIGTAPESKFSENYQSGPLSFEAIYKGRKIICNSGYYQNTKKNLNLISRSTAAHSTLILNNKSIASFKKNFKKKILNKLNFNTLNKNIVCERNYWLIKCSHDGYLKNYGTIHERSLEFFPEKNKFVGTDKLIKNKNFIPTNFDIRFHLMPTTKVTKTQDKDIILIELENSAWRFYSVNGSIDVETGLYFGNKNDYLENQNIFISGLTEKDDQVIKWEITKIE